MNRLRDCWDRDLTCKEIEIERERVIVSKKSCGNPVMKMLKQNSENYEGDEGTYIEKDGIEIVSSYRHLMVAHNASGFAGQIEFNSLVEEK